jgi:branched-chain amino acid transport system ATP-binding protein
MLKLKEIHSHYGQIHALKGVSLEVKEGSICCLIGANGAGKSTTLMSISGIQRITSGDIEFRGKPINGRPPEEIVRRGIVQVPEGRRIFPLLTVQENLTLGAYLRKDKKKINEALMQAFSLFPILEV